MKHHLIMLVEGPRDVLDEYAIHVEERSIDNIINGKVVRSVQVSRQFKFHLNMPSDFFLLPKEWTDEFSRLTKVFADYHIFLASAFATMVRWMMWKHRQEENTGESADHALLKAQRVSLCTDWEYLRGTVAMIDACLESSAEGMGVYHPMKLGMYSKDEYQWWQTSVQLPVSDEVRSVFNDTMRTRY